MNTCLHLQENEISLSKVIAEQIPYNKFQPKQLIPNCMSLEVVIRQSAGLMSWAHTMHSESSHVTWLMNETTISSSNAIKIQHDVLLFYTVPVAETRVRQTHGISSVRFFGEMD